MWFRFPPPKPALIEGDVAFMLSRSPPANHHRQDLITLKRLWAPRDQMSEKLMKIGHTLDGILYLGIYSHGLRTFTFPYLPTH